MLDCSLAKPSLLAKPRRKRVTEVRSRTSIYTFSKWHQSFLAQADVLSAHHAYVHSKLLMRKLW